MKFKVLVIVFLLAFSEIGCHKKSPTDNLLFPPKKSYFLYIGNGGHEVFVVDTEDNAVVDTLSGFANEVWGLAVTKSGARLYVCTREGLINSPGKVFSVDLYTKGVSLIWTGSAADVFVAPDGKVFFFTYPPHSNLAYIGMIDTLSDVITFIDTLDVPDRGYNSQLIAFDKTRPLMYGWSNKGQLFCYNYATRTVVKTYHDPFGPSHMLLSPDGSILYCPEGAFDLQADSAIPFTGAVTNFLGYVALSPDGEYLYVTDPGDYMRGLIQPSGKVYIFRTSTNSCIGYIDVNRATGQAHTLTDQIVITPDGKTAYVSGWLERVFVIDLQLREVIKIIQLGPQISPMVLGVKIK